MVARTASPGRAGNRSCAREIGALTLVLACAALLALGECGTARAQEETSRQPSPDGQRLVVSGQASVSVSSADHGYYNYSSYSLDLLRLAQFDLSASFRVDRRILLVADLRADGSTSGHEWEIRPQAAFIRFRPWPRRAFDIQGGIIPPVFGSFGRRAYARDNPLVGMPLAYQYLTSLRSDSVPASADELLGQRGRGWLSSFSVGETYHGAGLPVIDGLRNQLGVEVRAGSGLPVEVEAAVTSGSLSVPRGDYAPAWRQFSGRVAVRPFAGLVVGVSGSRGIFLAQSISAVYPDAPSGRQTAIGFDAEWSLGHWLLRTEEVVSRWRLPRISAPYIDGPLDAFGISVEGRYRLRPGLDVAARFDHLDFSEISGSQGTIGWEAPVGRVETGLAYSPIRRVVTKLSWQWNWRDTSFRPHEGVVAAQVLVWF